MNDLEILSKYLSDEELKEIAKEQARIVFNERYKGCRDYIFKEAATTMLSEEVHTMLLKDTSVITKKVKTCIEGLSDFDIKHYGGLDGMLKKITSSYEEEVKMSVHSVISDILTDDGQLTLIVNDMIGEQVMYLIEEALKLKFSK